MTPAAPPIELIGYSFQYRTQSEPTLRDIDLRIEAGQKVAIVGASGSGKSTLIHALNGLIPHRYAGTATGTIRVAGADPAQVGLVETARHVGTVLQDSNGQFVGLTVAEDIAFSLENQQVPHEQMAPRVRRAAELAHIAHRLDASPHNLSGGQKQRVAIAGVLVDEVEVLLFDEPLANLDPASGLSAVELIDTLHRDLGATVVIVEHRLEDVLHRDVDRIILMDAGRIIADDTPDRIIASGLLEQHGIRPPLHVAALRYAGAPVTAEQHPGSAERIELTTQQVEAMRTWVARADRSAPPRADARPPALTLTDVGCTLRPGPEHSVRILDGITARVDRGEMIGVLGSNGAGKSTLARVICGFEQTTDGVVRIGSADAAQWSIAERGEQVGFVLQEPGQMLSRPLIAEEIALGMRARGWDEHRIAERTAEMLDVCGLAPFRSWPISALSHGQKKRVSIACVLALDPDVLILDEPTAGQDFAHYTEFMDFLHRINARGTTVLLITHDMHLALEYTDRVLVMSDGRLIADDDPARVLTDQDVCDRADLVTTGLHTLAQRCGIADAHALVRRFVEVDRAERARRRTEQAQQRADAASAEAPGTSTGEEER